MQPELVLDAKKLNGGYTTRSALEMLPPFHMDMGVGGIDSCPRVVVVRLTNPGQRTLLSHMSHMQRYYATCYMCTPIKPHDTYACIIAKADS